MATEDRIAKIFENGTIFVTGGSGFLGKVLVEKLLRCCGVKRIYLLVRDKKGKTSQERITDIFNNVLFDTLKSENPAAISKCKIIPGDVTEEYLGISPEQRQILYEEVEFIFNSAASTRFDDSLKRAVTFNTQSTKTLLELAENCKKLKAFIHVSTAYAFPKEKVLYEKAYKPPADPHMVLGKMKTQTDEDFEKLLGDYPNTYSFSKALAESLVIEKMGKVPAIVVRPSVVCPTWRSPIKGWCNNLQGPMGIFVGAGKGIIRTMYLKGESYADFIPADVTINAVLVSTWNFLTISAKEPIYNLTTSEYNLPWAEMIEIGRSIIYKEVPFNGVVWYPGGSTKNSRFYHNVCFYLFQLIPAIFLDGLLMVLGYKPLLYQIQRRIQKGSEIFEYYTTKAWNFSNLKGVETQKKLNKIEKEIYKIDGEGFDVKEYLMQCLLCVRRNNLNESDDTIPGAKRHMKIMWVVDILTKTLIILAILYYFYQWIVKPILSMGQL